MATIKKMMKKKSAPKKAMMMMKKAPAQPSMGGGAPMMKMGGKIKKAQSGYSTTAKAVDSLRAVGTKQLGTPEGTKTLGRLKAAEAKERKEDAIKMKSMKMSGSIKKAQKGKKLPSGASSASAESDYAKSDSLRNVANKMTGKDFFENARLKKPSPRIQSDSLKMEGDRKTKATGGVPRDYRFKMGGKVSKMKSKMSKKK